jgi:peptidyl-prolyl cis-trans isomerase C
MNRVPRFVGSLLLLLACSPDRPREAADGSAVVAHMGGQPVTRTQLEAVAPRARSRKARSPGEGGIDWDAALRVWAEGRVLTAELEARGLDQRPEYRSQLASIRARAIRAEHELVRETVLSDLQRGIELSDAELRGRYEAVAERFRTTRIRLRQITVPDRPTAVAIRKRFDAGVAFEELASQANVDPALRARAGDLGWLPQRRLPSAVIGPAHRLTRAGEVSELFRDREGRWNLVQLVGRDEAARDFEEVRDQLERELHLIRGRERLREIFERRVPSLDATLDRAALEAQGP